VIARVFFVAAALAWIGMMACFIGVWFAAGEVPNRPSHMRINRLNILADRSLWTPRIAALNRAGVRFGLATLACLAMFVLALLAWPWRAV
jgi:hypothetical protein